MMQGHMGTVAIVIEKLRDGGNGDCSDYSLAPHQTTPGPSSLGFAACRSTSRRVALATVRTQEPKGRKNLGGE